MQIVRYFSTKSDKNLAFHVGDKKEDVVNNHKNLAKKLNYDLNSLVYMNQIHSNIVKIVENESFYTPITCDALITNKIDTPLMVMVADCTPVLFYDKTNMTVAVAHVGRAGAFLNIIDNVIDIFINRFNSKNENIYVEIGPSICQNCYEVSKKIADEAKELDLEYAVVFKNNSYFLDIKKIILTQLHNLNIINIKNHQICNACNTDRYFSYRKEQQTGRFSGLIMLKES